MCLCGFPTSEGLHGHFCGVRQRSASHNCHEVMGMRSPTYNKFSSKKMPVAELSTQVRASLPRCPPNDVVGWFNISCDNSCGAEERSSSLHITVYLFHASDYIWLILNQHSLRSYHGSKLKSLFTSETCRSQLCHTSLELLDSFMQTKVPDGSVWRPNFV